MTKRMFVCPKDISIITGLCLRSSQRLLQHLRALLNKLKHQRVTVKEVADYLGIPHEDLILH